MSPDFSASTLDNLLLPNPEFAAVIDKDVLKRYMHVGGVRIEGEALITVDGFEKLTTAPKGAEMLNFIRKGAKCQHGLDCSFRASSPFHAIR